MDGLNAGLTTFLGWRREKHVRTDFYISMNYLDLVIIVKGARKWYKGAVSFENKHTLAKNK